MKVYIRDKRVNPRVIYIDGKRYVLPSNKEVLKDISRAAFNNLSAMSCLSLREYVEPECTGDLVEVPEEPKKEEKKITEEPKKDEVKKEEPEVDVSGLVVEDKLEDSSIISPVEESKPEETKVEETKPEEHKEEAPEVSENKTEEVVEEPKSEEEKPNYSSMTKTQLKEVMKEKGGDPSGMTKANIIDWLNSH